MRWVDGLEVVIHAAGPPSVRQSFEMPEEYIRVHVQGTTALLQACRSAQVKKVVYLSSAEVYGRAETNPVAETHRLQPRSPYAAAKIAAENMIEVYAESFGLNAIVLRPFSIYGPNPTSESLFGTILSMVKKGCIHLHDLRPVRDYCYVDDLAVAVLRACSLANDGLKFFNIGTGKGTSVADFAQCVLHALGTDLPVIEERSGSRHRSEIFDLVADATAAQDILGWTPKISLHDGLRRAIGAS
jgi:nucleoside-diphosphate-sugar epimerase